jgi:hypothetical protein
MKKVVEVLEGLREEERRLLVELSGIRRAIAALEEVTGTAPKLAQEQVQVQEQTPVIVQQQNTDTPAPMDTPGPYAMYGSLYEAAAAYLTTAGEPKAAREIAEALKAGGFQTRATDFTATVRTMLHRGFSARPYGIYPNESGNRWLVRA